MLNTQVSYQVFSLLGVGHINPKISLIFLFISFSRLKNQTDKNAYKPRAEELEEPAPESTRTPPGTTLHRPIDQGYKYQKEEEDEEEGGRRRRGWRRWRWCGVS